MTQGRKIWGVWETETTVTIPATQPRPAPTVTLSGPTDDALALSSASCDVKRPTGFLSGSARKPEEPLAARGRILMKKANDRQSPPKLLGGCAPSRGALVAIDATAAACWRDRGGLPS